MKKNLLTLLLFLGFFYADLESQIVDTQFGTIEGSMNGSVYQFLGVPFAKPPTGDLRWKAPLNPDNWSDVLQTTSFSPVCPQKHFVQGDTTYTIEGDEDCLYLNIWSNNLSNPNKPVMLFIHGGGNQQGGASELNGGALMYEGKNIAERGDVVVVTIQYRLGPLGYLVHPGLESESTENTSGNYAVMDQLLALKWVQQNIANFGGDPSNVMIFGESAGGVNVGNLLTTSEASGLFHKACIQSAIPTISDYNSSEIRGIDYVANYISTGTEQDKIAHMRTLSSDSLLFFETNPVSGGMVQMNWQPTVDGFIFTDTPLNKIQSGDYNKVPLIIGSNSEEMSIASPPLVTPGMVNLIINTSVPTSLQAQAHSLYPSGTNNDEARASYVGLLTDGQFTATTRRVAQCVSKNQSEPVWRYFFTHKHTLTALESLGSYHGMELFYVFNTWENATLGSGPLFGAEDDAVQQKMLQYWVNFAHNGNPNDLALPTWPLYDEESDCYLEIKANPDNTNCGLRTEKCDLWDDAVGFVTCTSSLSIEEAKENLNAVSIYPNPASNQITINLAEDELLSVKVVESGGKFLFESQNKEFSVANLENGVYFISVKTNKGQYQFKLLKN